MQGLKGLCEYCLGCNRLEDMEFEGTYNCESATAEQIEKMLEELRKEKKDGNSKSR